LPNSGCRADSGAFYELGKGLLPAGLFAAGLLVRNKGGGQQADCHRKEDPVFSHAVFVLDMNV